MGEQKAEIARVDRALIREYFTNGAKPYHCIDCIEPEEQDALDAVVRLLGLVGGGG